MTDYFGQVVEIETETGAPTLDITDDRADVLWVALKKLGYPPFGRTVDGSWTDSFESIDRLPGAVPARVRMTFAPNTDLDGLQDLLDELDYRQDGSIVRVIV